MIQTLAQVFDERIRENAKQALKDNPELLKRIENEVKVKLGFIVREEKPEPAPNAKAAAAEKK